MLKINNESISDFVYKNINTIDDFEKVANANFIIAKVIYGDRSDSFDKKFDFIYKYFAFPGEKIKLSQKALRVFGQIYAKKYLEAKDMDYNTVLHKFVFNFPSGHVMHFSAYECGPEIIDKYMKKYLNLWDTYLEFLIDIAGYDADGKKVVNTIDDLLNLQLNRRTWDFLFLESDFYMEKFYFTKNFECPVDKFPEFLETQKALYKTIEGFYEPHYIRSRTFEVKNIASEFMKNNNCVHFGECPLAYYIDRYIPYRMEFLFLDRSDFTESVLKLAKKEKSDIVINTFLPKPEKNKDGSLDLKNMITVNGVTNLENLIHFTKEAQDFTYFFSGLTKKRPYCTYVNPGTGHILYYALSDSVEEYLASETFQCRRMVWDPKDSKPHSKTNSLDQLAIISYKTLVEKIKDEDSQIDLIDFYSYSDINIILEGIE